MEKLNIHTPTKSYPVCIGRGLRHQLYELIKEEAHLFTHYYIISDTMVAPLYLNDVKEALKDVPLSTFIVSAGEESKSMSQYSQLITHILEEQPDRKSCIVALGGGVVGDLSGFVAATLLRGIGFIQLPTTVQAHDSSVGGKVGINHEQGKNLIGAFYHPDVVIYDTETLETLPSREIVSGFIEIVKLGMIYDKNFYLTLKNNFSTREKVLNQSLDDSLYRGIQIKADIVEKDEREQGIRSYLNLGHTLGHALEKELGYGTLTHGEAVAIGIVYALKLSENFYNIELQTEEIKDWFVQLGISFKLPQPLKIKSLIQRMYKDKKTSQGQLNFVLLKEIGKVETVPVKEKMVRDTLSIFLSTLC